MEYKINMDLSIGWILTLIFVVLKLTKFINWSWIWVISPLWISILLSIIIFIIILIIKIKIE